MSDTRWTPVFGEGEQPTLESAVAQAVGTASTCWVNPPVGEFDSDTANWVVSGLLAFIAEQQSDLMDALAGV